MRLRQTAMLLPVGAASLVLAASAAGTTSSGAQTKRFNSPVGALAIEGSVVAYGLSNSAGAHPSQVFVWDVASGKAGRVSGRRTASSPYGLSELALTGSRVAWIVHTSANTSSSDLLFLSSPVSSREQQVASVRRTGAQCGSAGPKCVGSWIGGLVSTGTQLLVNRYTTASHGPGKVGRVDHAVTGGALYTIAGRALRRVATGTATVEASSGDLGRVAVLRPSGSVGVYSSAGKRLLSVTPTPRAAAVALSGRNLLVLEYGGALALYNSGTGALRKTFRARGESKLVQNLGVQGNIAIYTTGVGFGLGDYTHSTLHALDLTSGKDRVIGSFGTSDADVVGLARIGTAGVVYSNSRFNDNGRLVFLPWSRVAAAVR